MLQFFKKKKTRFRTVWMIQFLQFHFQLKVKYLLSVLSKRLGPLTTIICQEWEEGGGTFTFSFKYFCTVLTFFSEYLLHLKVKIPVKDFLKALTETCSRVYKALPPGFSLRTFTMILGAGRTSQLTEGTQGCHGHSLHPCSTAASAEWGPASHYEARATAPRGEGTALSAQHMEGRAQPTAAHRGGFDSILQDLLPLWERELPSTAVLYGLWPIDVSSPVAHAENKMPLSWKCAIFSSVSHRNTFFPTCLDFLAVQTLTQLADALVHHGHLHVAFI